MAHMQHVLWQTIQQHPGLVALASSSIAGPLLGIWTHNGAHVPGYGRLLTQAEAHAMPPHDGLPSRDVEHHALEIEQNHLSNVNSLLSPNILPVHIFGQSLTVSNTTSPRYTIPRNAAPPNDTPITPLVSTETAGSVSPENSAHRLNLAEALVILLGATAAIALINKGFQKVWSKRYKPIATQGPADDMDALLIAYLQSELQQASAHKAQLQENTSSLESDLKTAKGTISALKRAQTRLFNENTQLGLAKKNYKESSIINANSALETHQDLLDIEKQLKANKASICKHTQDILQKDDQILLLQTTLVVDQELSNRLKSQVKSLEDSLAAKQVELAQASRAKDARISGLEITISQHAQEKTPLDARLIALEKASADKQAGLDVARARNAELNKINQENQGLIGDLEALLYDEGDRTAAQIAQLSADKTSLTEELQKSERSDGEKVGLLASLQKSDAKKTDEIATLQNELQNLSDELQKSKLEARKNQKAYEHMKYEKDDADKQMAHEAETLEELTQNLTEAQEKYDVSAMALSEKMKEVQQLKQEHSASVGQIKNDMVETIAQLKREKGQVQYNMDSLVVKFKKLDESSEEMAEDRNRLRKEINKLTSDLQVFKDAEQVKSTEINAQIATLQQQKLDLEAMAADRDRLRQMNDQLTSDLKTLKDTEQGNSLEIASPIDTLQHRQSDLEAQLQTPRETSSADTESVSRHYFEKALKNAQEQHQKQVADLQAKEETAVRVLDAAIEKLENQVTNVQLTRKPNNNGVVGLGKTASKAERDQLQRQVTNLHAEKDDVVEATNVQLQDLRHQLEQSEKTIQAAQVQHEKQVAELQGEKDASTKANEDQLQVLRTELDESSKANASQLQDLRQQLEERDKMLKDLQEQHQKQLVTLQIENGCAVKAANHEPQTVRLQHTQDKEHTSSPQLKKQSELDIQLKQSEDKAASLQRIFEDAKSQVTKLQSSNDVLNENLLNFTRNFAQSSKTASERKQIIEELQLELQKQQGKSKSDNDAKDAVSADLKQRLQALSDEYATDRQQLESQLEEKTRENRDMQAKHELEVKSSAETNEQQQAQIQELKQNLTITKTDLESSLREVRKLRTQQDALSAEVSGLKRDHMHEKMRYSESQEHLHNWKAKHDELQDQYDELSLQHNKMPPESKVDELASGSKNEDIEMGEDSGIQPDKVTEKVDILQVKNKLKYTKSSYRDDCKLAVRAGIFHHSPYPVKELIQLHLPFEDPMYDYLKLEFPLPCYELYENTKKCENCERTYTKAAYHDHGPMCIVFYTAHAINCKHCENVFVNNDAFQAHEKICAQHAPFGASVEVYTQYYAWPLYNLLFGKNVQIPASPTITDIIQLKATIWDFSGDALMRAVLPYADLDYTLCRLPRPVKQESILPKDLKGDTWGGKRWCGLCHEWYIQTDFHEHLKACGIFFNKQGKQDLPSHVRCEHCGDIYLKNDGYFEHKKACEQSPTKKKCPFCQELQDVKDNGHAEHIKTCYPNRNGQTRGSASSTSSPAQNPDTSQLSHFGGASATLSPAQNQGVPTQHLGWDSPASSPFQNQGTPTKHLGWGSPSGSSPHQLSPLGVYSSAYANAPSSLAISASTVAPASNVRITPNAPQQPVTPSRPLFYPFPTTLHSSTQSHAPVTSSPLNPNSSSFSPLATAARGLSMFQPPASPSYSNPTASPFQHLAQLSYSDPTPSLFQPASGPSFGTPTGPPFQPPAGPSYTNPIPGAPAGSNQYQLPSLDPALFTAVANWTPPPQNPGHGSSAAAADPSWSPGTRYMGE
ncbi:hypothetical protein BDU57DRAFT_331537 [Ampelomyces quisqualis]|uniref:Uncharacterized protein n=1 Tax=Ampelomyces quisqualis TaxID=50730 RepID=A0A6A5QJ17_AMPQU|nr:hypothetical protein BDU57DRAFT_331537 [Ampelomyces quisqualis]